MGLALREKSESFEDLGAWFALESTIVIDGGDPTRVSALAVTHGFFTTLGAELVLSRDFLVEDTHTQGAPPGAILSHGAWLERFSGDPDALNRTLVAGGAGGGQLPVLGFTLLVTVAAAVLFGLAPVLRLSRVQVAGILKEASKATTSGGGREGLRSAFVVAQLAVSVVLVIGAALPVQSFENLLGTDPGFRSQGVVAAELNLGGGYADWDDVTAFYEDLRNRAAEIPGAAAAGLTSSLPFGPQWDYPAPLAVPDRPVASSDELPRLYYRQVDEGFFEAMGIGLLYGRDFEAADRKDGMGVVALNQTAARRYWPEGGAVGRELNVTVQVFGPLGVMLHDRVRVVGVVEDVKYRGPVEQAEPGVYFPFRQAPFRKMTVVLRTDSDAGAAVAALRREIRALDPALAVSRVNTREALVSDSLARERLSSALLGAEAGDVVWLVLARVLKLTGAGLAVGIAAAAASGRFIGSQLHGVSASDPLTYGVVAAVLARIPPGVLVRGTPGKPRALSRWGAAGRHSHRVRAGSRLPGGTHRAVPAVLAGRNPAYVQRHRLGLEPVHSSLHGVEGGGVERVRAGSLSGVRTQRLNRLPDVQGGRGLLTARPAPAAHPRTSGQAETLHISFRVEGEWSEPRNLGSPINSTGGDIYPSVTPDGKYLLFTRRAAWETSEDSDILWVSTASSRAWEGRWGGRCPEARPPLRAAERLARPPSAHRAPAHSPMDLARAEI